MDEQRMRARERERALRRRRRILRRKIQRFAILSIAAILLIVFVVRGIIIPISNKVSGGKSDTQETTSLGNAEDIEVAEAEEEVDPTSAIRQPLKGKEDIEKLGIRTSGWHDNSSGRWYQNIDGTYYANGFQEINDEKYYFDENGYITTGWLNLGVNDYYFNDDGSYDPTKHKPLLCLTFDDGPGQYTDKLLDCLAENNAHATFFMLGELVSSYPDTVKKMYDIGCELGSHSWDHPTLTSMDLTSVAKQYADTDAALQAACGHPSTVARAPYGSFNQDVINAVGKPFFMWSLDSLDWKNLDVQVDYDTIMNGDLTDGSVILMHDIHQPSVDAALEIIPDLIDKGYKLVTVSEMAEAKGVDLQAANYTDFWLSSLVSGQVPGYDGSLDAMSDSASTTDTSGSESGSGDTTNSSNAYDNSSYSYDSYDSSYSSDSYSSDYYSSYDSSY